MSDAEDRQTAREAIERHVAASERDAAGIDSFLERVRYVPVDGAGDEGWPELKRHLGNADAFIRLFYLAVAPELFGPICPAPARQRLLSRQSRGVMDKPIRQDSRPAQAWTAAVGAGFAEYKLFRISNLPGNQTETN